MKRNENRIWFDEGYSQAYTDCKIETFWPKILLAWFSFIGGLYFPFPTVAFLIVYISFEYQMHRDRKKHSKNTEPPEMWKNE